LKHHGKVTQTACFYAHYTVRTADAAGRIGARSAGSLRVIP
jgi:hypothetical protein